ncbi:MAG: sugar phosphate nucleotidyltransferase [Microgenomates group bacterium]|nr:sugar phosphate nucleotidyltransferase [Microgenomates group bacterium]
MRRTRITITINKELLDLIDNLVDKEKIRNRSHAIEYVVSRFFQSKVKKAIILAGGKGTKLRPYTYEIPKSLLPIKGKPILEYLIENLKKNNIVDLTICLGYLGKKIKDYFGDGQRFGVKISYLEEKFPLQTGGAVLQAKKLVDNQPFLVIHGDILTNLKISDLINFHQQQKTIVTIALTTVDKPNKYGQLALHGTRLTQFYHQKNQQTISHLVNCGIYVFEPEIFNFFPKNKKVFLLEDVIQEMIKQKKAAGFVFEGKWFDVGTPENYEEAIKKYIFK